MENEKNKGIGKNIIIAVLVVLLLIAGGYIGYDKFLKNNNESKNIDNCPICEVCEKCETNTNECNCLNNSQNYGEKLSGFKEIKLTKENQTIKIGSREFKVKNGTYENVDGYLSIDDYVVNYSHGLGKVHMGHLYLTDKFMFATSSSQDGDYIAYVKGEKNEIGINNNEYQMHDFKLVDGYLHASGHIFCGLDGDCPDKDLIIKYIDNTLIVVPA